MRLDETMLHTSCASTVLCNTVRVVDVHTHAHKHPGRTLNY